MIFYEMFNFEDHTECLMCAKSEEVINIGELIQFGLPKQLEYEVVGKKHIFTMKSEPIKVVLYVKRLHKTENANG